MRLKAKLNKKNSQDGGGKEKQGGVSPMQPQDVDDFYVYLYEEEDLTSQQNQLNFGKNRKKGNVGYG